MGRRGFRRAIAIDARNAKAHQWLGNLLVLLGRHEQALDHLHESIELDPYFPAARLWMGQCLAELGRWDEAIAALRVASDLFDGTPMIDLVMAQVLARAGATDAAVGRVERLRAAARGGAYVPRYELAKVELALGHRDTALRALGRAYHERSLGLAFLRTDPHLAPLRATGSVDQMAHDMGLA